MGGLHAPVNCRGTFGGVSMDRDSADNPHPRRRGAAPRTRAIAFASLVTGAGGLAVAYASAFFPPPISSVGPWLMAVLVPLTLCATMILGAVNPGRPLGPLKWPFLGVFLLVAAGFLLALLLPVETPDSALVLGLPRRAAVVLYGVGVVPLVLLPVVYALTFDTFTLSDDDLARVRAARRPDSTAPRDRA